MKRSLSKAAGALGVAIVFTLLTSLTASAAPLVGLSWAVSNNNPGASGVRYTWTFQTATASTLDHITMTVPGGTTASGGLSVATSAGVPIGSAALNTGTNTVTYTFSPTSIPANTNVQLAFDGFTNTSTPNTYISSVTTWNDTAPVDNGDSNTVNFDNNNTQVTVQVARTTSMTNNVDAVVFLMDPSAPWLSDLSKDVVINISTNAGNGYTLSSKINHQLQNAGATRTIAAASNGVNNGSNPPPVNSFGYSANVNGDGTSAPGLVAALGTGNTVGFTTAGEVFGDSSGPTNNDVFNVHLRTRINYHTPADTYTGTITFTVIPNY